jgi:PIN domain nuclease of toxin-antitoxin system
VSSMKILLDTHILLWSLSNSPLLSSKQKNLLFDTAYEKWVSDFSFMEIAIKVNSGKLKIETTIEELIGVTKRDGFQLLPVKSQHIITYVSLPLFDNHKDPFDRFLIATAKFEQMDVMTSDEKFNWYSSLINIV